MLKNIHKKINSLIKISQNLIKVNNSNSFNNQSIINIYKIKEIIKRTKYQIVKTNLVSNILTTKNMDLFVLWIPIIIFPTQSISYHQILSTRKDPNNTKEPHH